MALDQYSNFAYSNVAIPPVDNQNGRQLTVISGQGSRFPAVPFNVVVWPLGAGASGVNAEILRVTAVSGDIFTVIRTQEGSSLRNIQAGDNIAASVTAKAFSDIANNSVALAIALS